MSDAASPNVWLHSQFSSVNFCHPVTVTVQQSVLAHFVTDPCV